MKYIVLCLSLIVLVCGCRKEGFITYNMPDNIYFSGAGPAALDDNDSVDVSFAHIDPTLNEMYVRVPLSVTGVPGKADRTYKVVADEGTNLSSAYYELPANPIFRAGMVRDTLVVKLKKGVEMQTEKFTLVLKLVAGGDFQTEYPWQYAYSNPSEGRSSLLHYKITVSDMFTPGPRWPGYSSYFGTFSKKKILLIHELSGLPIDFYTKPNSALTGVAEMQVIAVSISRYLADQKASGNTIYDEDGSEMKMGAAYQ